MCWASALWLSVGCALGEKETVDGIEWWYEVTDMRLIGPTDISLSGDVVLPAVLGGKPIKAIASHASFSSCTGLTSVTIPDSVTSIGDYAFGGCTGLTNVTFGIGVTNIGVGAFSECINLYDTNSLPGVCLVNGWVVGWNEELSEDVDLTGIRGIAGGAFSDCGLMNVTIPDSATIIGEMSFSGCSSLTTVTIGDGVTCIGRDAFYNCSSLTSVAIGGSVTSIGDWAFYGCEALNLDNVTIPDSVTSIGDSAFYGAYNGDGESVPGVWLVDGWVVDDGGPGPCGDLDLTGIRGISDRAFYNCSCLESVTIPEGVTHIGAYAFESCSGLTNVTMPDGLKSIGERAFFYCDSLTSVTIPDSVTDIGGEAFDGCYSLTAVYIHDLAAWCEISFENDPGANPLYHAQHLYLNGVEVAGNLVIPDGVTSIGSGAFYECSGLANVTIPDSVTNIGYNAFFGCSSLTSVSIPDGVTSLRAFSGCSGLASVTLPESITSIGGFSGCSSLTNIIIPGSVTNIEGGAFSGCSGLAEVTIPDGVTSIGDAAFSNCWSLTSVTIPDSVTRLGNAAFSGCRGLTSVTILGNVTNNWSHYLYSDAVHSPTPSPFYPCTNLSTLVFGGKMSQIGNFMFYRCRNLTSVTIPDGVTRIGVCAFYGCRGLTIVRIPDSVTSIEEEAFSGCSGLRSVTIPKSVTSIGKNAFSDCGDLETLYVPATWEGTSMLANAGIPNGCTTVYVTTKGVPCSWLDENAADILAANGGDHEAAASAAAANGRPVWECYLTGVDPAVSNQLFEASLEYDENGKLTVKWTPDLNEDGAKSERLYWVKAKKDVMDAEWSDVTDVEDLEAEGWSFFRVGVKMP